MTVPVFFTRLFCFGLTGLLGMAVDFGVTWLLKEKLRVNKYLANAAGFSLAVINNYIINRVWTFESQHRWGPELFRFALISLVGLGLNSLLIYLLHGRWKLRFYYAKLAATGLVFLWNFTANFFFNFTG